jgi:hypothetical protein
VAAEDDEAVEDGLVARRERRDSTVRDWSPRRRTEPSEGVGSRLVEVISSSAEKVVDSCFLIFFRNKGCLASFSGRSLVCAVNRKR